jgi:hypothetical protein
MRQIILLLFLLGLLACNSVQDKKQSNIIEDRLLYPRTDLSPLFDSLRPVAQTFKIKGNRDTFLIGNGIATLVILKNTFINSQGQFAEKIDIKLVEVKSIEDIIKSNLQTTCGDRIMQTGGMFYIDAKENEKSLAIAKGKSIYVELSSNFNDPQMKIFAGNFGKSGKIDWTIAGSLENSLIPIPLSLMNFHKCDFECGLSKRQTDDLSNQKFENTFIATREFEDRCCVMMYATCPQSLNLSQKFLDIYMANINKPLYQSDSLIVDYLIKNHKNKIDTTRKFGFDDIGWFTYMFQSFTELKNQHLTNTINFDKLGINANTKIEELISRGYTENEAGKFIAFFKLRKQIINTRETEKQTLRLASYSFNISKLGWVNVDRFIDEKNSDVSTFLVRIKSKDTLDFISVSLVIPNYNVAIFSIHNEGNIFSFTKKNDGYRKLPIGQDATIVAFSYKDKSPYFGKKRIKIPKNGEIDLTLNLTTEQAIKHDIMKMAE